MGFAEDNPKAHAVCHWILAVSGGICLVKDEIAELVGYAPSNSLITKFVGFILALAAFSNVFGKQMLISAAEVKSQVKAPTTPVVDETSKTAALAPSVEVEASKFANKVRVVRKRKKPVGETL